MSDVDFTHSPKAVVIVGAGPGGLASALLLASRGVQVQVFERDTVVGGRTRTLSTPEGYHFDAGPTFFLYPKALAQIFAACGERLEDHVELRRLDPQYRIVFEGGGEISATPDLDRLAAEIARIAPDDARHVHRFFEHGRAKLQLLSPALERAFDSWRSLASWEMIGGLPKLQPMTTVDGELRRFFKDPRVRLAFSFQTKYIGMSPFKCPSLFSILAFMEYEHGVYHPVGGCGAVTQAMAALARRMGVQIHLDAPVERVIYEGGEARGVAVGGREVRADAVVVNADFARAVPGLVPEGARPRWRDRKIERARLSCSTFMLYLGIEGTLPPEVAHHNILLSKDYARNIHEVSTGILSEEPSVYLQHAGHTDAAMAPPGCTSLYILAPVPNLRAGVDWEKERGPFRERVLDRLQLMGLPDIRDRIRYERVVDPRDWRDQFAVHQGATFNLSHDLRQMLFFRPHNRFGHGLYLVGGGTHPGSGLPVIFEGARITSRLLLEDLSRQDAPPGACPTSPRQGRRRRGSGPRPGDARRDRRPGGLPMNMHVPSRRRRIAVVGGGLGGLSAACVAAARGHQVTLYEKNGWLGGKAAVLEADGFRFDMGPTILTVPAVLDRIFAEGGRRTSDYLDLRPLDPQWRCFFDGGDRIDLMADPSAMSAEMERFAPGRGVGEGYRAFLDASRQLNEVSDRFFLWKSVQDLFDVLDVRSQLKWSTLRDLLWLRMHSTVAGSIRAKVPDARLAQMLDHFVQYVGSSPYGAPAVLCAIAHLQTAQGVWYPMGGTRAVAEALMRFAEEQGAVLRPGEDVEGLAMEGARVAGVKTARGVETYDAVISNMDAVRTYRELVGGETGRAGVRRKAEPACSGVVLYLGLKERYDHLLHHNFVFSRDPKEEFDAIYKHGEPAPDPTAYVCAPSATEPGVAPAGGEALYVLVHTPYLRPHHDWRSGDLFPRYRQKILDKLKTAAGLTDIEDRISFERHLTPQDIHERYRVLNGAIYGLASHGRMMGAFKPGNRSRTVRDLYLAGGAAHPGPGMPMVMMSGWIAADAMDQDIRGVARVAEEA